MSNRVVRLFRSQGDDRVAVVSTVPSHVSPNAHLVRVARGPNACKLTGGSTYGPFAEEEVEQRIDEFVEALIAEGFLEPGLQELLAALDDPQSAVRARAALRLGWRKNNDAVEPILQRIDWAVDELCSYIDALGAVGDARAMPAVQKQAQKKLLSRRRSAVEALRNLDDAVGLADAHSQGLARLPKAIQDAYQLSHDDPRHLRAALEQVEEKKRGLVLDGLYELASPAAVQAVRPWLEKLDFSKPFVWRYVKSMLKRSMLRHDFPTFGWLAHRIERNCRSTTGSKASVKSGYDGNQRNTPIFRRKTQQFVRRLCWRYLRRLAAHRGDVYPLAAAEAIVHYTPQDAIQPLGLWGQYADCYLLHRVLWGESSRYRLDERRLRFRFASARHANRNSMETAAHTREEPFPHLWDAQPRAYLRLLSAGLPEVHQFALRAIDRSHPKLLQSATTEELLPMLSAPHDRTINVAVNELKRRFNPQQPDWELLGRLVEDERSEVIELASDWLRASAPSWTQHADRIIEFLQARHGVLQSLAAELLETHPPNAATKAALADRILSELQTSTRGNLEGIARAARALLLDELAARLSVSDAMSMIAEGSAAAQTVAAEALSRREGVLQELGLARLASLGMHQVAAVRGAAHTLLRQSRLELAQNPDVLYVLVESPWQDSQRLAIDLLRGLYDWSRATMEQLLGLLDSNKPNVQNLGKELAGQRLAALGDDISGEAPPHLDAVELVCRLSEHPHPNIRRFALELIHKHLPDGAEMLARLTPFFRSVLLDTWPQKKAKAGVVRLLVERGLRDPQQASVVMEVLSQFVLVRQQDDFESALQALTLLHLAFPEASSDKPEACSRESNASYSSISVRILLNR